MRNNQSSVLCRLPLLLLLMQSHSTQAKEQIIRKWKKVKIFMLLFRFVSSFPNNLFINIKVFNIFLTGFLLIGFCWRRSYYAPKLGSMFTYHSLVIYTNHFSLNPPSAIAAGGGECARRVNWKTKQKTYNVTEMCDVNNLDLADRQRNECTRRKKRNCEWIKLNGSSVRAFVCILFSMENAIRLLLLFAILVPRASRDSECNFCLRLFV